MGERDNHDQSPPPRLSEPVVWLCCLMGAVMPTSMLVAIAQGIDRTVWPAFGPLLYIGVFTILVLVVRPWTFR